MLAPTKNLVFHDFRPSFTSARSSCRRNSQTGQISMRQVRSQGTGRPLPSDSGPKARIGLMRSFVCKSWTFNAGIKYIFYWVEHVEAMTLQMCVCVCVRAFYCLRYRVSIFTLEHQQRLRQQKNDMECPSYPSKHWKTGSASVAPSTRTEVQFDSVRHRGHWSIGS